MKTYKIVEILNKDNQNVCKHYQNRECTFEAKIGCPLKVKYINGTGFTHEKVLFSEVNKKIIMITTTNKLWSLEEVI